ILDIVCDSGPPQSFELRAGMMAVIPQGAWHRFQSPHGAAELAVTPFPGEHIERDVDDPREVNPTPAADTGAPPGIVDFAGELAKLTMFRGRTPRSTIA